MQLMLVEFSGEPGAPPAGQFMAYPGAARSKCDLWFGHGPEWVVEAKMARFSGDNGKPDDTAVGQILSPYPSDHSALSDCAKLAASDFQARKAVLIYGFEHERRPVAVAISAFEVLARNAAQLGPTASAGFGPLIHPALAQGCIWAWEVGPSQSPSGAAR